jgi:choline-sulfatase
MPRGTATLGCERKTPQAAVPVPPWMRIVAGVWIAALLGAPCTTADTQAPQPTPVILISIDTLRADHLSAYGYTKIRTSHIDSFAQGGTLFTRAETQIPLTLPAHTCLFTSTYPFQNRIEENGERVPGQAVTLASVLRVHGYKTAAFIGSDFLDQRFGLDQGFDVYDSPFNLEAAERANPFTMTLRRDGALVVRAARQWLDRNRGQSVFAFIHLFDLHSPYTLPESAARARGISRYDAQLVYVDEVLGRFQQALKDSGWWDRSLVVLLSDHGEGLGDHRESDHGYFIYESTVWVPLILHWPSGAAGNPATASAPAGLIDVAPTILDFLRMPAPASFAGNSQLGALRAGNAGGPTLVYSESLYAHDAFRWAPLRSLREGKYKYIAAPRAELYDLETDPHEQTNLLRRQSAVAAELHHRLNEFLARYAPSSAAPPQAISPETLERLESLGYLAVSHPVPNESSGPDPKDRLPEFELYQAALLALQVGHASSALPKFLQILREDPRNTLARFHLGECYLKIKRPEAALREWTALLKFDPTYSPATEALGQYWLEQGDYAKARLHFEQVLALNAESFTGQFQLGIVDEHLGLLQEAVTHLEAACKIAPHDEKCARALSDLRQKMK